jgi:hypothetical protein
MTGIRAITIYDSTGNRYQFDGDYIQPSADPFTKNPVARNGGRVRVYEYTLTFSHCDAETHASLIDNTLFETMKWRASIAYFDGFTIWDSDTFIEVSERSSSDPSAEMFPYKITLRKRGSGYAIAQAHNLVRAWQLAQLNELFIDHNSDNIADGFTNSGFTSLSFYGGNQSVTWASGTDKFYIDITFPVSGLTLTGGVSFTSGGGNGAVHMEDQDRAGTAGSTDTTVLSGVGYEAASITTASDAYTIRLEVRATGTETLLFDNPFIRLNGGGYTNS